jgi:SulP family sulfate permease
MLIAAPLLDRVPLAALAAILLIVAWNMSEIERIRALMKAPIGDRLTLIVTFALTVLVDLTVAIQVGVVLGTFLFMHRMAGAVEMETGDRLLLRDRPDRTDGATWHDEALPEGVIAFRISGPFFFGVAGRLGEILDRIGKTPRVFILRLGDVPLIDATGAHALEGMIERCARQGTVVILEGLRPRPLAVVSALGLIDGERVREAADQASAVALAVRILAAADTMY